MRLRDGVPFVLGELLTGFNLRGYGKAAAPVFGAHTGVDGGVSAMDGVGSRSILTALLMLRWTFMGSSMGLAGSSVASSWHPHTS
jgi:hypothetical protein